MPTKLGTRWHCPGGRNQTGDDRCTPVSGPSYGRPGGRNGATSRLLRCEEEGVKARHAAGTAISFHIATPRMTDATLQHENERIHSGRDDCCVGRIWRPLCYISGDTFHRVANFRKCSTHRRVLRRCWNRHRVRRRRAQRDGRGAKRRLSCGPGVLCDSHVHDAGHVSVTGDSLPVPGQSRLRRGRSGGKCGDHNRDPWSLTGAAEI
jgi:hypothetical protein